MSKIYAAVVLFHYLSPYNGKRFIFPSYMKSRSNHESLCDFIVQTKTDAYVNKNDKKNEIKENERLREMRVRGSDSEEGRVSVWGNVEEWIRPVESLAPGTFERCFR